uniref:Uncharacterized protein n=1 Tax=Scleropages formosus TaxID=113540 RepID=A0A8C9T4I7_SCLFO
ERERERERQAGPGHSPSFMRDAISPEETHTQSRVRQLQLTGLGCVPAWRPAARADGWRRFPGVMSPCVAFLVPSSPGLLSSCRDEEAPLPQTHGRKRTSSTHPETCLHSPWHSSQPPECY